MTISLVLLEAMQRAGLDDAAQLAMIRAMLEVRAEHRGRRRQLNEQDSRGVVAGEAAASNVPDQDSGGMVGGDIVPAAAVEMPQHAGHVHNGNRKTVARAALLMHPRLRESARLVGARLVERAAIPSGVSYAGIETICRETGLSRRSVSRATRELAAAGLLSIAVHAGLGHANQYRLNWEALHRAAIPAPTAAVPAAAKMNDHDSTATMTLVAGEHASRVPEILSPNPEQKMVRGARRRRRRDAGVPRQRELALMAVLDGGKSDAGFGRAGQRLWDDLCRHGDAAMRLTLLDLVDRDAGLRDRATFAELRQPGSGLGVLLIAAGQGPPLAAASG